MKISSKLLKQLFTFLLISFFTFNFSQRANADPSLSINAVFINGVYQFFFQCGDTIRANVGDSLNFIILTVASGGFPDLVNLSYSGTPPAPFTFSPPLPIPTTIGPLTSEYTCPSLPLFNGSITFSSVDGVGESQCVVFIRTDSPLPVELSSFTSLVNNNNVLLEWTTASEMNNSGFQIQRRYARDETPDDWNVVEFINGHGTTTTPNNYNFTDKNLQSGKYKYRLKQIDFNGNFEYHNLGNEVIIGVPAKFDLSQNYPNPFNPSTKINYDLPTDGSVSIKLFDLSGKEVASLVNEVKTAGYHTVDFNASNLSSGVYFYNISVDANGNNFSATKRMMLVK